MKMKVFHPLVMKMMKMMMMTVTTLLVLQAEPSETHTWTPTPAPTEVNLQGKMFTLTRYGGGVIFNRPSSSPTSAYTSQYPTRYPDPTTRYPYRTTRYPYPTTRYPYPTTRYPYPTTRYPYRTTPYPAPATNIPASLVTTPGYGPPSTTPPPTSSPRTIKGLSICLRYVSEDSDFKIFTFPFNTLLEVSVSSQRFYSLTFNNYDTLSLTPNLNLWKDVPPSIWTSVCFVLDGDTNVIQMFSGGNISIRKVLSHQYLWYGEPQITFPGFTGQLTDVQVWDYPLQYQELRNYMTFAPYGWYRGSALTWFNVRYSANGQALLEDSYESLDRQPIRRRGGGGRGGRGRGGRGGRRKKFLGGGSRDSRRPLF